jgi:endonuclease/exonuclease/phosphatase family metal-dependent hydrolase
MQQTSTVFDSIKSVLRRFWFAINVVVVLFLLLSCLASYVSPAKAWIIALIGLSFPYLALLNLLFLFTWIMRGRKQLLLSLAAFIISWPQITAVVQIPFVKIFGVSKEEKQASKIKVLSYNVRSFNYLEWNKNKATRDQIIDFVYNFNPDVICFQEYFQELPDKKKKKKPYDIEYKLRRWPYHYKWVKPVMGGEFGSATFSRYPIVRHGYFQFKNSDNLTIYTDIKIDKDTVRFYNNHLQSYRFDKDDYALVDSISTGSSPKKTGSFRRIGSRLKRAFIQRSQQTDTIARHAKMSPYPVFICGDFNDTPSSYTYHRMKGNRKDAFMEAGWGISNTYAGDFPSFRIDYILYNPIYKAIAYHSPRLGYSDHYPVTSVLIKRLRK